MKKLNNLIDNAREKLKMFRLMILVLLINSFVLAQEKDWTLQLIQSNCPDIGTDEICNDTPFSEFTIRGTEGDEEDDERWWWANANTLGLSNYDKGSNKSGSFNIIVREGYQVKLKLRFETKGDRDFLDDIFPQISENKDGIVEVGDDYFIALLLGGDQLSVDIDDEWSGIPSFFLKAQGNIVAKADSKNGSINDEVFLSLIEVNGQFVESGEITIAEKKENQILSLGEGPTRDSAISDALRNAIEIGLGTYVTSVTEMEDYSVIRDKITSLSRGFVQNYTVIDEFKSDGNYMISLSSIITKEEIIDFAPSIGIKVELEGSLFYQQFALEDDEKKLELETFKNFNNDAITNIQIFNSELVLEKPFKLWSSQYAEQLKTKEIANGKEFGIILYVNFNPIDKNIDQINTLYKSVLDKIAIGKHKVEYTMPFRNLYLDNGDAFSSVGGSTVISKKYLNKRKEYSFFFPKKWLLSNNNEVVVNNIILNLDEDAEFSMNSTISYNGRATNNYRLSNPIAYKLKNEESIQEISKTLNNIFDIHKYQIVFDIAGEEKQTKDILINLSDKVDAVNGSNVIKNANIGITTKITGSHPNGISLGLGDDVSTTFGEASYNFFGKMIILSNWESTIGQFYKGAKKYNIQWPSPPFNANMIFLPTSLQKFDVNGGFQLRGVILLTEDELKKFKGVEIHALD